MRTTVISVLTLIVMSHSSALSLDVSNKARSENKVSKDAEKITDQIKLIDITGEPIIGTYSGGSINGFAGILYAIQQPPRIESVPITFAVEHSLYKYQIHASDANGDKILFTVVKGPSGLNINAAGLVSWTPSQEYVGTNDVQIAAYDDRSDSTIHTWSIEVSNQNDSPTILLPDTLVIFDEDSSVTISFVPFISDSESVVEDLVLTADSTLSIEIDNKTKAVKISGLPDSSGFFRVEFTLTDPDNLSSRDSTIVIISAVNDTPIVSRIPDITFLEDSTFSIDLDEFVTDVDNDTSELSWAVELADGDSGAVLTITKDDVGGRPEYSRTLSLLDNRKRVIVRGRERTNTTQSGISNSHENRNNRRKVHQVVEFEQKVPEPTVEDKIIVELSKITKMRSVITMSSESGELLDSVIISIDSTSHIATFTAFTNYFASEIQIVFTVTDPDGLADSDSSLLTIEPVNDVPELSALPDIVFNEDDTVVVNFTEWFDFVNDPDNPDSTLSWSITTTDSDSVTVIILGDSVLFTAPQDWFAFNRDTLMVTVTDSVLESSVRLAVHVLPINDAPSLDFIPDTLSFGNDTSLVMSFDSLEIDVDDADSLMTWFAAFSDSSSDSLIFFDILGDSAIRISSVLGWIGEDTLTIVVVDTSGAKDSAIVLIQIVAPVGIEDHIGEIPLQFEVFQNYPNPFNPTTTIRYALPVRSDVAFRIYNLMGQEVLRITQIDMRAGYHEVRWNGLNQSGRKVASGIYIYRLIAGDFVQTRKMVLLK